MIPLSLAEIAQVTGGVVQDDPGGARVLAPATVDSRSVPTGGLFVAVAGERVDGHDYAAAAVAAGAAAVLAARPTGVPTVVVEDPVLALGRLARHVVDTLVAETGLRVVALTGSQGKTGTKDYLAHLLSGIGPTVATQGNFNNEIGVPLTVLRATRDTRFLVVEMGARGIGHIAYLCDIAPPTIAGLLNVGSAHLGEFGSRTAIAQAKGEILQALPPEGVAVVNADDPDLIAALRTRTRARLFGFGWSETADLRISEETYDDLGRPTAIFSLPEAGISVRQTLPQVGRHQLPNAAAAAAMSIAAGLEPSLALRALGEPAPTSRWRMETTELADGTVVINDSYNANPESMRAALDTLAVLGTRRRRRTIAVLGEMRELGAEAEAEHRALGRHAAALGIDLLVVVDAAGALIAEGATDTGWPGEAILTSTGAEAARWVRENVASGDVVLVKASRGVALESVAATLIDRGPVGDQGEESR